ncbi:MAG: hypothetical protein WC614_01500 [bacterium]
MKTYKTIGALLLTLSISFLGGTKIIGVNLNIPGGNETTQLNKKENEKKNIIHGSGSSRKPINKMFLKKKYKEDEGIGLKEATPIEICSASVLHDGQGHGIPNQISSKRKYVLHNFMANGNFLMDTNNDGTPDGWGSNIEGKILYSLNGEPVRKCARILRNGKDIYLAQYLIIEPSANYSLSVKYNCNTDINLTIYEYSKENKVISPLFSNDIAKSISWNTITKSFTTSKNAKNLLIKFELKNDGVLLIDSTSIISEDYYEF